MTNTNNLFRSVYSVSSVCYFLICSMPVFIDQTGRQVSIPEQLQRIVSLVPSQTELLFDLGLRDEVVGITKFCVHPQEWFKTKTRVGGTKKIRPDIIQQLQPDL